MGTQDLDWGSWYLDRLPEAKGTAHRERTAQSLWPRKLRQTELRGQVRDLSLEKLPMCQGLDSTSMAVLENRVDIRMAWR